MSFKTYYDMGRIEQLRNSGRELIGKELFITVKRDGENCCIYRNPNTSMVHIGSHHQAIADDNIRLVVKATEEYPKILEILEENENYLIYVEHMRKGRGPTRIEMVKKQGFLVLIDIYDLKQERYMNYNWVYQQAHKHKIPIVKLLDIVQPQSIEDLRNIRDKWLEWCKIHHREGVVLKDYHSKYQAFAKEKINLPKKKLKVKDNRPQLPEMPEEKIKSGVEQGMAEILRKIIDPKNPKEAMPIIARYVSTEAREHNYASPKNIYKYYLEYLKNMHG